MTALAFKATYSDWKLIKTRGVVQVVMEVPLADADAAYNVLGGMPDYSKERWFGIAPIKTESEVIQPAAAKPLPAPRSAGVKRDWRDLSPQQQAGIHCEDPIFAAFLREQRPDDWHEAQDAAACVRLICGVDSRKLLESNQRARIIWHQLDSQYQAWKALEHA